MYGTHVADRLVRTGRRAPLARPYHCFQRGAGGSRTHLKLLCRQPPCRLAPAPSYQCPRQESNLVFDLRTVACKSATLRGRVFVQRPAEESNPVLQFRGLPCDPAHPQGPSVSTRNRTWIWTFGGSYAIRCTIETFSIPTWSRTRTRALGEPRAIRYTIGTYHQSRRLDLHQHDAVYRTAAFLFEPRRQQAGVRGFEPRGAALETASSPRRTLLYRPPVLKDRGPLA